MRQLNLHVTKNIITHTLEDKMVDVAIPETAAFHQEYSRMNLDAVSNEIKNQFLSEALNGNLYIK